MSSSTTTTTTPPTSLSHLCSVCHARRPVYRCPRCSTRTCSASCVSTHKKRTLCSGVRDPAAYASRAQLNTAAAFDRDFNFISGVERGIERAARDSERRGIDVRKLVEPQQLHSLISGRGRGGRGRGARGGARGGTRGGHMMGQGYSSVGGNGEHGLRPKKGELPLRKRLAADGITVLRAPAGMSRSRDNNTHWRPKNGGGISWTVEWIELDSSSGGESKKPVCVQINRGLTQAFEGFTLQQAFDGWRAPIVGAKRRRDGEMVEGQARRDSRSAEEKQQRWYLGLEHISSETTAHSSSSLRQKTLLPFDKSMCLTDLLKGRTVREFPTIYAWCDGEDNASPGLGYVLGPAIPLPVTTQDEEGGRKSEPAGDDAGRGTAGDATETETARPNTGGPALLSDNIEDLGEDEGENVEEGAQSDDDGDADGPDDLEQRPPGDIELERDVEVAADSHLGISGAIAAALMADMDGLDENAL